MRLKVNLPANNRLGEVGAKLILENIKALSVSQEEKKEILKKVLKKLQE